MPILLYSIAHNYQSFRYLIKQNKVVYYLLFTVKIIFYANLSWCIDLKIQKMRKLMPQENSLMKCGNKVSVMLNWHQKCELSGLSNGIKAEASSSLCCLASSFTVFPRYYWLVLLSGVAVTLGIGGGIKNHLVQFLLVHLKGLCELKHVVVVVEHDGDAHSEVILQNLLFVFLGFNVSYGEPSVVNILRVDLLIHKYHVSGHTALRHRTHDVCSNVGETKVVRLLKGCGQSFGLKLACAAENTLKHSGFMYSLLNMPMIRMSKPWILWSMKADTKKCFVFSMGVMVILVTEEGHEFGRPWYFGRVLSKLYIFRVIKRMMLQVMLKRMKTVKRLWLTLTLPLSIKPQKKQVPNLKQSEASVSQVVQIKVLPDN